MPVSDRTTSAPSQAKRRILDAAAKLFRERGFARSTVRELADSVGILSGSLFHHFASKDDILFTVMDEVVEEMDAALAAALAATPETPEQVRALIHNQLSFIHGPRADATAVLVYEWSALPAERQSVLNEKRRRYFARWQAVLEQARSEGLIVVSPDILSKLIHGATVWTARWFDPGGKADINALEDAVFSLATGRNELLETTGRHST